MNSVINSFRVKVDPKIKALDLWIIQIYLIFFFIQTIVVIKMSEGVRQCQCAVMVLSTEIVHCRCIITWSQSFTYTGRYIASIPCI